MISDNDFDLRSIFSSKSHALEIDLKLREPKLYQFDKDPQTGAGEAKVKLVLNNRIGIKNALCGIQAKIVLFRQKAIFS